VLPQQDLTGERLAREVTALLRDLERLRVMGERSRALGKTDAADVIVRECLGLIKHGTRG